MGPGFRREDAKWFAAPRDPHPISLHALLAGVTGITDNRATARDREVRGGRCLFFPKWPRWRLGSATRPGRSFFAGHNDTAPTTGIDMTTASPTVRENAIKDYQEARWTPGS